MPRRTVVIEKNDAGQRLDKFLTKAYPNLPQAVLYKCIRTKDVKRNGKRCQRDDRLAEGDVLTLYWQEEFFQTKPKEYDFLKAPSKLSIVYEDENLLLLDKQPGLIVHPDEHYHFDSLIARVQHYLYDKGEYDPKAENAFAPALVNRIDRNTGGIVMAAKNAEALRILNQKVKDREMHKFYLCVVCAAISRRRRQPSPATWRRTRPKTGCTCPSVPRRAPRPSAPATGCWRSAGASPWWRWSCSPAAPTRYGPTLPPSATPWPGTASTAKTP